ncbi:hypothetical protein V5799_031366 [Amblyomma americanum]|uniref:Uncharacterized protein n=1 Tax=Amblyomma americanum TaxID=6943 RepID=A0AAQ4EKZ0_AMBAM
MARADTSAVCDGSIPSSQRGGWRVGWQERVTVAAREEPPAMPFIEDDLLWCPNTDGKMVDLSCLDSGPNVLVEPQGDVLQELTHTDLHGLGIDEEEEILRQLNDPGFEIDAIFADLHEPQGAPTAVAVAPLPPLMQPQDDAVGISRKRRRRRSDDAPPGCSGLQQPSFHSVTVKIEPGTSQAPCVKTERANSVHLPDSTADIGSPSLTQLSPCKSLAYLKASMMRSQNLHAIYKGCKTKKRGIIHTWCNH